MDPMEDPAYLAWLEEQERLCQRTVTLGAAHDPYSASCELDTGHSGAHRSMSPFGDDRIYEWTGGGYCAGDPLPVTGRFVEMQPCDHEFGVHEHGDVCRFVPDGLADALNREAEEMALGRPLFPNEY